MPLPSSNSAIPGGKSCSFLDDRSVGGQTVVRAARHGWWPSHPTALILQSGAGTRVAQRLTTLASAPVRLTLGPGRAK